MILISSYEFNQDTEVAERAALNSPVFITDRGKLRHVLMSIQDYENLLPQKNIVELLACTGVEPIEFEPQKLQATLLNSVEL